MVRETAIDQTDRSRARAEDSGARAAHSRAVTEGQVVFTAFATLIGAALIVPQTLQLLRTRTAAGVSIAAQVCSCTSYIGWIVYAAHLADLPLLVSLLAPFALELVTALLVVCFRGDTGGGFVVLVWLGILLLAGAAGWSALGGVLGLSVVWGYGPAAWSAFRCDDIRGISRAAWMVRTGDGLMWCVYGIWVGRAELTSYGAAALALSLTVLAVVRLRRDSTTPSLATA